MSTFLFDYPLGTKLVLNIFCVGHKQVASRLGRSCFVLELVAGSDLHSDSLRHSVCNFDYTYASCPL